MRCNIIIILASSCSVVRTGSGLLVGRVECVCGQPRAVAGAARIVRVYGQPKPRDLRQPLEREVWSVGRHVGQQRGRRSVRGHRGAAVRRGVLAVVRARVAGRVVSLEREPLRDAAIESLGAPHAYRGQRTVAGSAVERRVWSHCNDKTVDILLCMMMMMIQVQSSLFRRHHRDLGFAQLARDDDFHELNMLCFRTHGVAAADFFVARPNVIGAVYGGKTTGKKKCFVFCFNTVKKKIINYTRHDRRSFICLIWCRGKKKHCTPNKTEDGTNRKRFSLII